MKYFSLLFALLFMASCHSKQKPSESQPETQDSIQVEQPERWNIKMMPFGKS